MLAIYLLHGLLQHAPGVAGLQAAADSGPGCSTSAPALASKFSLRPSRFQESLGKLSNNNMLTTAIGSTDGFENYRLTDYGAAYLQLWAQPNSS